jgi:exodeoxyribonuclease VII large subunit
MMSMRLQNHQMNLAHVDSLLHSLNPQAVLDRGYAIARAQDGRVVTDAQTLLAGDMLELLMARGRVETEVKTVKP